MPSYPFGIDDQGPNPEPWEFVWAGAVNIIARISAPMRGSVLRHARVDLCR